MSSLSCDCISLCSLPSLLLLSFPSPPSSLLFPFPSLCLPSFPLPRASQLAPFVSQWSRWLTYSRSHLVSIKEWTQAPPSGREEQAVGHHQDTKVRCQYGIIVQMGSVQFSPLSYLSLSPDFSLPTPSLPLPCSLPPSSHSCNTVLLKWGSRWAWTGGV